MIQKAKLSRILQKTQHFDSFAKNAFLLASSTAIGQIILIAFLPVLTRLYSIEEFGLFGITIALALTLSNVTLLHFHIAIPIVDRSDLAACLIVCLALMLLMPSIICLIAILFDLPMAIGIPVSHVWTVWGAATTLSAVNVASYLAVRFNKFCDYGISRIIQSVVQGAGQTICGLSKVPSYGLQIGYIIGFAVSAVFLWGKVKNTTKEIAIKVSINDIWKMFRSYWQFPVYAAPTALLQNVQQFYPTVLLSALFGPEAAGLFLLTQRVLAMPIRIIAQSVAQSLLFEISTDRGGVQFRQFRRRLAYLMALGTGAVAPGIIIGPQGWELIFGEGWGQAWYYVLTLSPLYVLRFVGTAVSNVLIALRRQDVGLIASAVNAGAMVASLVLAARAGWEPLNAVGLYGMSGSVIVAVQLALIVILTRQRAV